jgi:hypothetical protein
VAVTGRSLRVAGGRLARAYKPSEAVVYTVAHGQQFPQKSHPFCPCVERLGTPVWAPTRNPLKLCAPFDWKVTGSPSPVAQRKNQDDAERRWALIPPTHGASWMATTRHHCYSANSCPRAALTAGDVAEPSVRMIQHERR